MFFIIYQLEDCWSIMKLNCRPLTINLFKPLSKNKNRSGQTLCVIFYKIFENKKILLYPITWPLTLNFQHLVKKILLPAKFHFNPHWGDLNQYIVGDWGVRRKNAVEKYLWRSSYVSKVASYKPASLQIY